MQIELIIIIILFFLTSLLTMAAMLNSVSGSWRMIDPVPNNTDDKNNFMVLAQFGFVVVGKQEIRGGKQTFFGFNLFGLVWLKRRDYGIRTFINQGFPEELISQLNGQVMMRLKMRVSTDRLFLKGFATPYKIEFSRNPPVVTGMHAVSSLPRTYERSDLVDIENAAEISVASK